MILLILLSEKIQLMLSLNFTPKKEFRDYLEVGYLAPSCLDLSGRWPRKLKASLPWNNEKALIFLNIISSVLSGFLLHDRLFRHRRPHWLARLELRTFSCFLGQIGRGMWRWCPRWGLAIWHHSVSHHSRRRRDCIRRNWLHHRRELVLRMRRVRHHHDSALISTSLSSHLHIWRGHLRWWPSHHNIRIWTA